MILSISDNPFIQNGEYSVPIGTLTVRVLMHDNRKLKRLNVMLSDPNYIVSTHPNISLNIIVFPKH